MDCRAILRSDMHRTYCPCTPDTIRESQWQLFVFKKGTERAVRLVGAHSLSGAQFFTEMLFNCITIINPEILPCFLSSGLLKVVILRI